MFDRSDRERRIIEAIQALLLSNALQHDHLDLTLEAMRLADYDAAEMYLKMFADGLSADIDVLTAAAASGGEGMN